MTTDRTGDAAPDPGEPRDPHAAHEPHFQAQLRAAREEFESHVAHARDQFEEANERLKERTGRDLIVAILIGVGIGAVVLGSLLFIKGLFTLIALAGATLGTFEFVRALQASGRRVDVIPQVAAAAGLVIAAFFVDLWLLWVLLFAVVAFVVVWRLLGQMAARDGRIYGDVLTDVLISGFVPIYVPFLASVAVVLLRQPNGEWWVLTFLCVAIAADTGAYAIGLWLGKHKMAPRVSPGKTWEGFGGGALFALIAAVLLCVFALGLPWWTGLIVGPLILISATLGDLGESMVKRDLGIKDMSSWLPGHGGVLDRLDSLLPSAPVALGLCLLLTPLGAS